MLKANAGSCAGSYAFVLTDLEMPRMDGHEMVTEYQRWQEETNRENDEVQIPRIPVYSMSTNSTKQDGLRNAENARTTYNGFISKPITREKLNTVIFCSHPSSHLRIS